MYVCHCMGVTDRTVEAAIASGARTVADITERCGAGGGCGGCHGTLQLLLDLLAPVGDEATSAA